MQGRLEYIPSRETATKGEPGYSGTGGIARRRRIEFLLRVLDAPTGVSRPHRQAKAELEELLQLEWPD